MNQQVSKVQEIKYNYETYTPKNSVVFLRKEKSKIQVGKLLNLSELEIKSKNNYSIIPELPSSNELNNIFQKLRNNTKLTKPEELQLVSKIEKNNPALSIFTKLKR